jgi:hypothetical protein
MALVYFLPSNIPTIYLSHRYRDLMICVIFTGSEGLRIIGEVQVKQLYFLYPPVP